MKFQICTCKKHLFDHGYFFDENGSFFRGEGLDHLSGDIFSQADALAFIQEVLDSGKITLEEAFVIRRGEPFLSLPAERPSGFALYEKNENARVKRIVTPEGKKQLAVLLEPKYSLKRLFVWVSRHI
jgi:hypothetical protein